MDKRTPKYIIVFLMFAFAAGVTYWVNTRPLKVLFDADLNAVPTRIGAWDGEDLEITSDVASALDADEVLSRSYMRSDDELMQLLVVYRKYGRRGFAHRPEMCYPAAGWELVSKSYTTVPYGGRDIQAVKIVAQKDYSKDIIVYWFASGQDMEANFVKQQLKMAMDRLRTQKYGWAFIRINSPVTISEETTMNNIREFVREASDPLMSTLTGNSSRNMVGSSWGGVEEAVLGPWFAARGRAGVSSPRGINYPLAGTRVGPVQW